MTDNLQIIPPSLCLESSLGEFRVSMRANSKLAKQTTPKLSHSKNTFYSRIANKQNCTFAKLNCLHFQHEYLTQFHNKKSPIRTPDFNLFTRKK